MNKGQATEYKIPVLLQASSVVRNQMKQSLLFLAILVIAFSCKWKENPKASFVEEQLEDSVLANDAEFISQKLLKEKYPFDLTQYDTIKRGYCRPDKLDKQQLIESFEGFNNVGDLDKDGKDDYVFVLHPINRCEEGQSYYFSNPKIPRIETDSYCCHPKSLFSIGDIDEDGSNELGEFYSSCASRYKAITIWSLKSGKWKEIKSFSYCKCP